MNLILVVFWLEAVCQRFTEYRRRFKNLVQVCKEVEKGDKKKHESAIVHVWTKKKGGRPREIMFNETSYVTSDEFVKS